MKTNNKTAKKLTASAVLLFALLVCFGIVTYAFITVSASVEANSFHTGTIEISMSGSNADGTVIEENEFIFEPGMTVVKNFYVENTGTSEAYYKVYFENIVGELAKILEVTVKDGNTVLAAGILEELTAENIAAANEVLDAQERRDLTVTFYYPKEAGNSTSEKEVTFDLCAQAVQTRNNPDKQFD